MRRTYSSPPITEVASELRFDESQPWDPAVLDRIEESLRSILPNASRVKALEGRMSLAAGSVEHRVAALEGLKLTSPDDRTIVSVMPHRVIVSRLSPYLGWANFNPLVELVFDSFSSIVQPRSVTRLGLRYVNSINIPQKDVDPREFFNFFVHVDPALPASYGQTIAGAHFVFPSEGCQDILRITLRDVQDPQHSDCIPFILDFDYFSASPMQLGWEQVRGWLGGAHGRVGEAFEVIIKEPLRAQFGEVRS